MPLRELTENEVTQLGSTPSSVPVATVTSVPGAGKRKSPFTEGQTKDAGFAVRMFSAIDSMENLTNSGFNPTNLYDVLVENLPLIPDIAENYLLSSKYQQFRRASNDFAQAQLRKETGAQINESEMDMVNMLYIPMPGDTTETLQAKADARRDAAAAMRASAGEAFTEAQKAVDKSRDNRVSIGPDEAMTELLKRAKKDPELRARMRERGLINE